MPEPNRRSIEQFLNFKDERPTITPRHYGEFTESIDLSDGKVHLLRQALPSEQASRFVDYLRTNIVWHHEVYRGRPTLRGTAWFADESVEYRYSGQAMIGSGWDPTVSSICRLVEELCGAKFNSVLINRYPDGQAQMGWHADDELELGRNPTIASLSFGASRTFKLRHKTIAETRECVLDDNCLLVMAGQLQHHWQHTIPRRTSKIAERFNLTFRYTIPDFWKSV